MGGRNEGGKERMVINYPLMPSREEGSKEGGKEGGNGDEFPFNAVMEVRK